MKNENNIESIENKNPLYSEMTKKMAFLNHKKEINEIKITTEFIKVDQFLKFAGIAQTGANAKEIIQKGMVVIEGNPCFMRGKKLYNEDVVFVFISEENSKSAEKEERIAIFIIKNN